MKIVSLDLSLSATGWAKYDGAVTWGTLSPGKELTDLSRLKFIRDKLLAGCVDADFVLMEGLSFGSNDPSAQERSGLAYLVRMALYERGQKFCVFAPTSLKKFVTGSGAAKKEIIIMEVFKRFGHTVKDNNQADAVSGLYLGMACVGLFEPTMQQQRDTIPGATRAVPSVASTVPPG